MHLIGGQAQTGLHQIVSFADELHVSGLDAIVDHLDIMARAILAHPVAARGAILDLGGDLLKDLLNVRPGSGRAPRHDAGAVARALLAAGNTCADIEQAF